MWLAVAVGFPVAVGLGLRVGVGVGFLVAVGVGVAFRVGVGLGLTELISKIAPKLEEVPKDETPKNLPAPSLASSPTGFQPSLESWRLSSTVSVQAVCPDAGGLSLNSVPQPTIR